MSGPIHQTFLFSDLWAYSPEIFYSEKRVELKFEWFPQSFISKNLKPQISDTPKIQYTVWVDFNIGAWYTTYRSLPEVQDLIYKR